MLSGFNPEWCKYKFTNCSGQKWTHLCIEWQGFLKSNFQKHLSSFYTILEGSEMKEAAQVNLIKHLAAEMFTGEAESCSCIFK